MKEGFHIIKRKVRKRVDTPEQREETAVVYVTGNVPFQKCVVWDGITPPESRDPREMRYEFEELPSLDSTDRPISADEQTKLLEHFYIKVSKIVAPPNLNR